MSLMVQMGPPGSQGSASYGIGHAPPLPENVQPAMTETVDSGGVIMMRPDMAAMKKFKSLRDLAPESPTMILLSDTATLIVDMFKLSMATMLSIFVPQLCDGSLDAYVQKDANTIVGAYISPAVASFQVRSDGCSNQAASHECTFQENFLCLSSFNQFVLAWNFVSLFFLVFQYFLVWRREHFLIEHLHETLTLGRLHLRDIITDYPSLQIRLRKFNTWVFNVSVLAIIVQLVNLIASGILVFRDFWAGYKTFTTYATDLLLIAVVLRNCVSAAYVGLRHEVAYSCVGFEPVSYNAVDSKVIKGQ